MKSLLEVAVDFVNLLEVGREVEPTEVVKFRHLLPALLFRRGLYLQEVGGRKYVTDVKPWTAEVEEATRMRCRQCLMPWFDCPCSAVLILGAPSARTFVNERCGNA